MGQAPGEALHADDGTEEVLQCTDVLVLQSTELSANKALLDGGEHRLKDGRLEESCLSPAMDDNFALLLLTRHCEENEVRPLGVVRARADDDGRPPRDSIVRRRYA